MSQSTYFQNLEKQLPLCQTCAELQAVVSSTMASVLALSASLNAQIAALAPFAALLTAPTDLNSLIQWVENFITASIAPQAAAYTTLVAQAAELTSAVADLTTAINNAAAQIEGCVVTVPHL